MIFAVFDMLVTVFHCYRVYNLAVLYSYMCCFITVCVILVILVHTILAVSKIQAVSIGSIIWIIFDLDNVCTISAILYHLLRL